MTFEYNSDTDDADDEPSDNYYDYIGPKDRDDLADAVEFGLRSAAAHGFGINHPTVHVEIDDDIETPQKRTGGYDDDRVTRGAWADLPPTADRYLDREGDND